MKLSKTKQTPSFTNQIPSLRGTKQSKALNNCQLKTENYLFNCQLDISSCVALDNCSMHCSTFAHPGLVPTYIHVGVLTANCQLRHQSRKPLTEMPAKSLNISIMLTLFLTLSTLMPISSFAERIEYDVEILIFEDRTSQYLYSEKWPKKATVVDQELVTPNLDERNQPASMIITNRDSNLTSFAEIESFVETELEAEYPIENNVINIIDIPLGILSEQADEINRSRRYNVLLHKAWRQTGLEKELVIEIPIDSRHFSYKASKEASSPVDDIDVIDELNKSDQTYLDGVITVELARYLHFYTDLTYHRPNNPLAPLANTATKTNAYSVKTHRRMRSRVLHYIDHPLIGILVKIVPVDTESETEEVTDDGTNTIVDKNGLLSRYQIGNAKDKS